MKLPQTAAGRIELLNELMSMQLISPAEALDILSGLKDIPKDVLDSPLWQAMKEEK